jgi:hypothetical protein
MMNSKHFNIVAVVLFVASLVMLFLGLDSEKRPTTIPYCTAGMICLAVSIVAGIIGLLRTSRERRHTGV